MSNPSQKRPIANHNRTIKKINPDIKGTLKYQEERTEKVKKALFTYIQDNNVEIISDDQIFFEGKHQTIFVFAEKVKWLFENKNKNFPICSKEEYVETLQKLNADNRKAIELLSTDHNSKFRSEAEILNIVGNEKLNFSKSLEQAEEFLTHILFKVPDSQGGIKVVAKREYDVVDVDGNTHKIQKEILLPGFKRIEDYRDTLEQIPVRASIQGKQETYWDVFSRSKAVVQASMIYDPHKELYWMDEYKHYFINSYKEPPWKEEPDYYYLMQQHLTEPVTFNTLGNILRSFLIHLFPDEKVRKEVLKWCAFSNTEKLQTYLTLIGPPGIGKTLFVEEFLGYYHGTENLFFPKSVEIKFNAKCAQSTLLYFDEKMMTNIEQYNEMKCYINKKLSFEEKNKPIFMAENYANLVWSCNTKDTMSGMSRDDRRFKIVPITDKNLIGSPIFDINGHRIGTFNNAILKNMTMTNLIKKEFVLLMLSIRDHVEATGEIKDDINTISDNEARDTIFSESRSMEFIEIIDVLKNVYDDFNEITGKFGNKPMTQEEKDSLGTMYVDYIPLSKIIPTSDSYYTYRVPFSTLRKVIVAKAGKQKPMSLRTFNRHLNNMPPKILSGITRGGQARDIDIRLTGEGEESSTYFLLNLMPKLLSRFEKKSTSQLKDESSNPFEE